MDKVHILKISPLFFFENALGEDEYMNELTDFLDSLDSVVVKNIEKDSGLYRVYLSNIPPERQRVIDQLNKSDIMVDYSYFEV